ncbi:MAG TPA: hypothetical protein VFE86_01850, partial [Ilumatobacteraceae bacterium]|nr:hypothetical protein [Ilumatobacteraceae bacterium]
VHDGVWQLLDVNAAWDGNDSHDRLVTFSWATSAGELRYIGIVNLADTWSQGYVALPTNQLAGHRVTITDRFGTGRYELDGDHLLAHGLYVDVAPWAHHLYGVLAG